MVKKVLLFCIIYCLPGLSQAQIAKLSPEKQQLLLQLCLNYYTVVKEGRVDQDSSLLIVSLKNHLSRWPVITEGFGNELVQANNKWIDTRQPGTAVKELSTLHGIDHTKLLVLLGAYYTFQPGYHQQDRDSASHYLSKAKQESEALHSAFWNNQSLCLLGKNYYKGNKVKEGSEIFNTLISNCQKSGDKSIEAKAWDYQGSYCPPAANTIMLKVNSIKKANDLYHQLNEPAKQINTLMNLSYLGYLLKDIDGAQANALKALQLQKKINFPYIDYTLNLLTLIAAQHTNSEKELSYGLSAVNSALATRDSLGLAYFYAVVGHVKYGKDKTRNAFSNYWLGKSVEEFRKNHDPAIYLTLSNFVQNLTETGNTKEAVALVENTLKSIPPTEPSDKEFAYLSLATNYQALKNYHLAEKYFLMTDQVAAQSRLITKDLRNSHIKYRIAEFYFIIGKFDEAKKYLQVVLTSPTLMPNGIYLEAEAHMLFCKIDSAAGNYQSALNHLRKYTTLNRRVIDSNDSKQIAGLKIQFLMTQKEKDLQLLQAKSDLQVQQAGTLKRFILAGVAAALLIIAMLFNRYYINKKQKQQMDKKNTQLQHAIFEKDELLKSKEWLLKEVHHRVKNNLHTVICLLESQAAYLENDALKAIENSQHRIYAMSLIHQKLYQSEDIKTVDMSVYLPEFVAYLNDSIGNGNQVRFDLDIEPLKLGVSYAVPLSLIINEAVTNAIKYAFPENRKGTVMISMHKTGGCIWLIIADNGIGINTAQIGNTSNSLGLKLLKGLSEDIQGSMVITNNKGTRIQIEFKTDHLS